MSQKTLCRRSIQTSVATGGICAGSTRCVSLGAIHLDRIKGGVQNRSHSDNWVLLLRKQPPPCNNRAEWNIMSYGYVLIWIQDMVYGHDGTRKTKRRLGRKNKSLKNGKNWRWKSAIFFCLRLPRQYCVVISNCVLLAIIIFPTLFFRRRQIIQKAPSENLGNSRAKFNDRTYWSWRSYEEVEFPRWWFDDHFLMHLEVSAQQPGCCLWQSPILRRINWSCFVDLFGTEF